MADEEKVFKRINFFRGFLTTEDDWNSAEAYHVRKHMLHNAMFHGAGILPGALDGFLVTSRGRGELAVEVKPGYAIDGQGHDIILNEVQVKPVTPADFPRLPANVYVVVKFIEEPTDFIAYKEYPDYKGYRRIAERCKIDVTFVEPNPAEAIELARIFLTADARRINDARDPADPKQNEIDLRFRPSAGVVGTTLPANIIVDLKQIIDQSKPVYTHLFHYEDIKGAGDVLHALVALEMLLNCNLVDRRNFFDLLRAILRLQWGLVQEVERTKPEMSKEKPFFAYKKHVDMSLGRFNERVFDYEFLKALLVNQNQCHDAFSSLFSRSVRTVKPEEAVGAAPVDTVLDQFAVYSGEMKDELIFNDIRFRLADWVNLLDRASEESHKFEIREERDKYRTRQTLKYPDGTEVQDAGIAYEGGYCQFEIRNVVPHKPIIMITRMDYVHGDWKAEMYANGEKTGVSVCEGDDKAFRWRNWPYVFREEFVNDTRIVVKQVPVTADRDINMFKIWFYQPV